MTAVLGIGVSPKLPENHTKVAANQETNKQHQARLQEASTLSELVGLQMETVWATPSNGCP